MDIRLTKEGAVPRENSLDLLISENLRYNENPDSKRAKEDHRKSGGILYNEDKVKAKAKDKKKKKKY